jgi:hypothetical protein
MPTQENIDSQYNLLETHRRTLAVYLKQEAEFGNSYTPPVVKNGIREARNSIRRCKDTLRRWGVSVEDHPDDDEMPLSASDRVVSTATRLVSEPPSLLLASNDTLPVFAEYPIRPTNILAKLLGGAFGCILGLAGLVQALRITLGIVIETNTSANAFLIGGLIALAIGAAFCWEAYTNRALRACVYPDRLEYHCRGTVKRYLWSDISKVWISLIREDHVRDKYTGEWRWIREWSGYTVATDSGKSETISKELRNIEELEATIREQVKRNLMPLCRADLRAGRSVTFGSALTLTPHKVQLGKDTIDLRSITRTEWISETSKELLIHRHDSVEPMRKFLSADIYNFFIFTDLVNELVKHY